MKFLDYHKERVRCKELAAGTLKNYYRAAIVYAMASGGFRLGAWDYLRWKYVSPINNEKGDVIAAKLLSYANFNAISKRLLLLFQLSGYLYLHIIYLVYKSHNKSLILQHDIDR